MASSAVWQTGQMNLNGMHMGGARRKLEGCERGEETGLNGWERLGVMEVSGIWPGSFPAKGVVTSILHSPPLPTPTMALTMAQAGERAL